MSKKFFGLSASVNDGLLGDLSYLHSLQEQRGRIENRTSTNHFEEIFGSFIRIMSQLPERGGIKDLNWHSFLDISQDIIRDTDQPAEKSVVDTALRFATSFSRPLVHENLDGDRVVIEVQRSAYLPVAWVLDLLKQGYELEYAGSFGHAREESPQRNDSDDPIMRIKTEIEGPEEVSDRSDVVKLLLLLFDLVYNMFLKQHGYESEEAIEYAQKAFSHIYTFLQFLSEHMDSLLVTKAGSLSHYALECQLELEKLLTHNQQEYTGI